MTHTDAGHYAAKHPAGAPLNEQIAAAVKQKAVDGGIDCAAATAIAGLLGATMQEVGRTIDLLEIRLKRCQLGLFGFDRKEGTLVPAERIEPALEKDIRENLFEGRLPCISAWGIADGRGIPRMAVSSACERLKIKIKPCQLGAF